MSCVMVILNYNDSQRAWSLAEKCIFFKSVDRVVIVDNCSTDESVSYLSSKKNNNIDFIVSPQNNGFASGNNIGARYALEKYNPDYLFFANTDTVFDDSDVEACLKKISSDKDLGLISMRMIDMNGNEEKAAWKFMPFYEYLFLNFWLYRHFNYDNYTYKEFESFFQYVDVVRGSYMMFRSEALSAVDFFDEGTFLYYEEDIVSFRLRKAGYKVGMLTDHFYIHNHIYSGNQNSSFAKKNMDNSLKYFLVKYYGIGEVKKKLLNLCTTLGNFELFFINKLDRRKLK